jgi:serine/threonine protein kinase
MAPEQAAGKTVDYRADIYALGLMLYEMFTGTQPFHAENAVALAVKHMQESPQPPREIEPSISGSVDSAILKCLEKAPESRFQSISELEATLRSQLPADRSTTLYPASTSNAAVDAAVATAVTASTAPPVQKTRRAGPIAAILVVSVVALGAGIVWRGRAPRDAGQKPAPVRKDSSSPVPNVSVAATPNPLSITTNAPLKPAMPAAPKPKKVATSPHADASVASSDAGHSAPLVSTPVAPIASQSGLAPAGTTPPDTAAGSSQNTAPPPGDSDALAAKGGGGYVWVNRFPREVGAQNAAKRIEEMGLPVTIIPRHNAANDNDFFVVLTGPYPAARIDGIVEQLKAKGFVQARLNRAGAAATNPVPRSRSAPAP